MQSRKAWAHLDDPGQSPHLRGLKFQYLKSSLLHPIIYSKRARTSFLEVEERLRVVWALICLQHGRVISQDFKSVNIDDVESGDNGTSLSLPLNMCETSHLKNLQ